MSGTSIRIDSNEPEISARLTAIGAALGDTTPLMQSIGAAMLTSTQRRFETKTDPAGVPWRPLSRRTAKERAKRGRDPANILRLSGRLYNSLTYQVSGGFGGVASVAWGTNVVYGAVHQFGGTINVAPRSQPIYRFYNQQTDVFDPRFRSKTRSNFMTYATRGAHTITIPARAYLGISDDDRSDLTAIVGGWLSAVGGVR